MYQCSNCGSGLKYDITSGKLLCNHCASYFNPYSIDRESDGYEDGYFEATHFVCPQCGGEILSTDNAAAGFCSYCGASTILTSRISKELRPGRIVPFKITKEQCHDIFKKRMRKAIFAPRAFKNVSSIQGFRGIYMPYWLYRTRQNSNVKVKGSKHYSQGNYSITDYYDITAYINAEYNGFYYDASSSFYDNISEQLAPFDFKDAIDFAPSFYSGFYADIPDVPREVYEDDAIEESFEATFETFFSDNKLRNMNVNGKENQNIIKGQLNTQCDMAQGVMLPVWFMSYRAGNRVAYATINGQNGKIVTDIPVDKKKYIASSIIMAIPIFILLNFLFTVLPSVTLSITSVLAAITSIILYNEMSSIYKKENNIDDKGLAWAKKNIKLGRRSTDKSNGSIISKIIVFLVVAVFVLPFCFHAIPIMIDLLVEFFGTNISRVILKTAVSIISVFVSFICFINSKNKFKGLDVRGKHIYFVPVVSSIIASGILMINPVSDIFYYIGALISIISVITVFMAIIGNYNILCMRYLPQFDKQGGDDNA